MTRVQIAAYAVYGILGLALAISVVTDLRTRKILNKITLPTILLCLAARTVGGAWGTPTGPGLCSGLIGLAIGFGFFFVLNLMGGMGMGDVKLTAAVGAGVGFPGILACLVFIGLVGGGEAVAVLVWQGRLLGTLGGMLRGALQKAKIVKPDTSVREKTKIPYGVAIALGTAWGVWWAASQTALPSP